MGKNYLIDTNVIIDLSADRFPEPAKQFVIECIDNLPAISIITKIELLGFSFVTPAIKEFVKSSMIIGLTDEIAEQTIVIRKNYKVKLPDAVIAASAIEFDRVLVTPNVSDFKKIRNLEVVDLSRF